MSVDWLQSLDLPESEPTPPGIPAEHIDPDEFHSLFDFEDAERDSDTSG